MIYKHFQDIKLSALSLGCMRLPTLDGDDSKIDQEATQKMVDYAMENGVNYYDTAWGYHGGNSEIAVGKALKKHPRDKFYLASKFPGYDLNNMDKVEEIFEKQLEKCGVDYFDFYLFHNVCEMNVEQYLDPKYRIYDYLMEQKRNGRIRHLGFSAHGDLNVMRKFLEAYGKDMEFCQLQINWLDWTFQQAREKVELVREYGIPVWVMEPVRGGKLASLSEKHTAMLRELRPDESTVAWAFRFLQTIPDVVVTLSGMSNFEQLRENIEIFKENKPLNEKEISVIAKISNEMTGAKTLPCTACRYCVSHCPQGLDIPMLIDLYNEHNFTGGGFLAPMRLGTIDNEKQPSSCIACKSCEAVCPQQIKISEAMSDFSSKL